MLLNILRIPASNVVKTYLLLLGMQLLFSIRTDQLAATLVGKKEI